MKRTAARAGEKANAPTESGPEGDAPPVATLPRRVQLRRTKGWRMPMDTVKVDRSTRWGNPWRVGEWNAEQQCVLDAAAAVQCFRAMLRDPRQRTAMGYPDDLSPLRGKHLACWCAPDVPCHADVLLATANA